MPMTDADREHRLRELFERALPLSPADRDRLIAETGDEVLAERLRALLAQDERGTAGVLQRAPAESLQPLRRIGNYELLRTLGSGGMGTVALARQLEPVERLVAIKMVHAGSDSREVLQRFETERQSLAIMDHPGIAQIFDGGTTDDGVPYFVMEYVRGEPIGRYCDRRRLGLAARLALFAKVCEAMQHAHQKAVLHRDLKPGNVLVTEAGGSPQPKVIDFGVARALAGGAGARQHTAGGVMIGTFAYMSPEQADPRGQDVDTRSDVYSLGVMLYELLTGELPLDLDIEKVGYLGMQRALLETTPPLASARVAALPPEKQERHARDRDTRPAALCRQLQGDLDWILARALEKDRNRRYASAAELAAELQRHAQDEPVAAGPPTARYRIEKFVRRHWAIVLGASLLALGLTAGTIGATSAMFEARTARDVEAAARRQQARELRRMGAAGDYLEILLFYGDPGLGAPPPNLREVLDRLTPTIPLRYADRPVEAAAVHAGAGRAYLATGETTKAEQQLRAAWQLMAADDDADAARACRVLADLCRARRLASGQGPDAAEVAHMLELAARALAAVAPAMAPPVRELRAALLRSPIAAAELQAACEQLFARIVAAAADPEAARLSARMLAEVAMHLQEREIAVADDLLHRLEDLRRREVGDDVDFLLVLARFGEHQLRAGCFEDARRLGSEVMEGLQRFGLQEHWLHLRAERIRGLALAMGGEPAAGEAALLALQRRLGTLPAAANEQAQAAARALVELTAMLQAAGKLDEFFAASLGRWQNAAGEAGAAPWWPADVDGLPANAIAAARAAVERASASGDSPALQAVRGALLLREDRAEAAAPVLAAALAAQPQPSPELLADLAIVRHRLGDAPGAAALLARLRDGGGDAREPRRARALQRAAAAGVR
jgi:serine/threonine protein kinase